MKKIILSILSVCLVYTISYAQCSKTYSGTGVYPSQLPDAYEQVQYSQEIDFTFPVDTTVQSFSVHIDSLIISKVVGFPGNSFTFNCSVQNCTYVFKNGMTYYQGCFMINGTAPKGSAGTYKLKVDLEGYFQTPFGSQTYIVTDSSVNFTVKGCSVTASVSASGATSFCKGDNVKLTASGANKFQWLNMNAILPNDTNASITVTDSGIYRAIVWDATTGCFDTSSATTVVVNPLPTKPVITASATSISTAASGVSYQWYKDTTAVSGATSASYTPTVNGKYKLKVTNASGCSSFSDELDFKNTNVATFNSIYGVDVFPNPANYQTTVVFGSISKNNVQFSITDVNGRSVLSQTIAALAAYNTINIDLSGYAKGIYIIKLQSADGTQTRRLTIE